MRGKATDGRRAGNNSARMTATTVAALRADHGVGLSTAELAAKYVVSKSQVRNITSGRHWKEAA
jgi:DNA-binding transcriptional regulator YiaG